MAHLWAAVNPLLTNVLLLYPLKTLVKQKFGDVSRGYKMEPWSEMCLDVLLCCCLNEVQMIATILR